MMLGRVAGAMGITGWWLWFHPLSPEDPVLRFIEAQSPAWYWPVMVWSAVSPAVVFVVFGFMAQSVWRVWFERMDGLAGRGELPDWPQSPDDEGPSVVIGEVHHRTRLEEVRQPGWLVMNELGLYTGLAIFGAVGTGKTVSAIIPFARQLLSWKAKDKAKRAAALMLEVKGDLCYKLRKILKDAGRAEDYIELNLERTGYAWNPLAAPWLDAMSLASTIAQLIALLHGGGKDPFWAQAYTNLGRWIIELKRLEDPPWVTLRDVYHLALDHPGLGKQIKAMRQTLDARWHSPNVYEVTLDVEVYEEHKKKLGLWEWQRVFRVARPKGEEEAKEVELEAKSGIAPRREAAMCARVEGRERFDGLLRVLQRDLNLVVDVEESYKSIPWGLTSAEQMGVRKDQYGTMEGIERWYQTDWSRLAEQTKTNVVEGLSVFLGVFDKPDVQRKFAPGPPPRPGESYADGPEALPPLDEVIESGKVLCLNMPKSANPELGKVLAVMLKLCWLSTLLLRPARMSDPRYKDFFFRPAVLMCDEYQEFASVGGKGSSGDEKAFALTRQSKVIPLVATQSLAGLRAALGGDENLSLALLQTLRSKVFLSLGDEYSQKKASEMCGQVERFKASFGVSENTGRAGVSWLTGRTGGGGVSAGMTKNFAGRMEALFPPREFTVMGTFQAIAQIYDGKRVRDAVRCYLKPDFLPRSLSYHRAREEGKF